MRPYHYNALRKLAVEAHSLNREYNALWKAASEAHSLNREYNALWNAASEAHSLNREYNALWKAVAETESLWAKFGKQSVVSLQMTHSKFYESYATLLQSVTSYPTEFQTLPPVVTALPTIEFYNSHHVLEVFSEEDVALELQEEYQCIDDEIEQETENSLEILLSELDPALIRMWRGINDTPSSESEDRVRHFFASSRELFTHIVHQLAPDADLREWTDDSNHFHENRPTRKARVLYICRRFDRSQFSNFVDKDVNASIALLDLFQSGVDAIETDLTPGQMRALKTRFEGTLRFLLETAKTMRT